MKDYVLKDHNDQHNNPLYSPARSHKCKQT